MKELKDAKSWRYRGEGAANIVLTYCGDDDPELIGKVLRLHKSVENDRSIGIAISSRKSPVLSEEEQKIWADYPDLVLATTISELNHVYARDVLRPLLGDYVDPGMLVYVGDSFIKALDSHIGHKRPAWRAESGSLGTFTDVGLLISDHTRFLTPDGGVRESPVTISVELKPKCGFLPTTPMIKEETSVKKRFSRFTMHQQLKFFQGKIEQISKYDPLDLFSGTRDGILKAIRALFETPQNNLRIFSNGDEVFGTAHVDKRSMSDFDDALEGFVPAQAGERVQAFQLLVADFLWKSDVLSKLLVVQRLDYHDIEGAIQAYDTFLRYHQRVTEKSRTGGNPSSRKATEDLRRSEFDYQVEARQLSEKQAVSSSASVEDCRNIVRDFLMAATAKDCGLMLTLQLLDTSDMGRVDIHDANTFSVSGGKYLQKTLFLDVDCKRLKKMNYYLQLDQEIVEAYKSITS